MALPSHKTKIVCTIGPACDHPEIIERMIGAGMDVARLNFSHGDFPTHKRRIEHVRAASRAAGKRVAILADLPGPKMRIGELNREPIELQSGDPFVLTVEPIGGDEGRVSVSYSELPRVVKPGDTLFLNDGLIQLEVLNIQGNEVRCTVMVGGELRSRKGLNLPGIHLGIRAFTDHDGECLRFAMDHGVDAVSQSFVEGAEDMEAVRSAAASMGCNPFLIAKIERSRALNNLDAILDASDGIMIARGDLGVEVPIEQIALLQKRLMRKANLLGKPVITATQMLESMVENRRPTRAEATDVANAILDGADCVMLSGESAIGKYPVDAVSMLARIAASIEPFRDGGSIGEDLRGVQKGGIPDLRDVIAHSVVTAVEWVDPAAVFVPTRGGNTARSITRFRIPVWIVAVSAEEATCQGLVFSYGVHPVHHPDHPENWREFVEAWMHSHGVEGKHVVLTEGPSRKNPGTNNRMEIIDLDRKIARN